MVGGKRVIGDCERRAVELDVIVQSLAFGERVDELNRAGERNFLLLVLIGQRRLCVVARTARDIDKAVFLRRAFGCVSVTGVGGREAAVCDVLVVANQCRPVEFIARGGGKRDCVAVRLRGAECRRLDFDNFYRARRAVRSRHSLILKLEPVVEVGVGENGVELGCGAAGCEREGVGLLVVSHHVVFDVVAVPVRARKCVLAALEGRVFFQCSVKRIRGAHRQRVGVGAVGAGNERERRSGHLVADILEQRSRGRDCNCSVRAGCANREVVQSCRFISEILEGNGRAAFRCRLECELVGAGCAIGQLAGFRD